MAEPISKSTKQQLKRLRKHKIFQTYSTGKKALVTLLETSSSLYFGSFVDLVGWGSKDRDTTHLRNSLNYLERKGYVKKVRQSGKSLYILTLEGEQMARKLQLKLKFSGIKWDGRWRFLMFDIPEDQKQLRDGLRNTIKFLGFKKLQASVWVFPYDIFDDLEKLIPDIRKHQWIKLVESDNVINDRDIYIEFFGREKE